MLRFRNDLCFGPAICLIYSSHASIQKRYLLRSSLLSVIQSSPPLNPLDPVSFGQIGFQSSKSGFGEQLLLTDCKAKVRVK